MKKIPPRSGVDAPRDLAALRQIPPGYAPGNFPRPSVTTDVAVFSVDEGVLEILLIRRGNHPFKDCWALPGGFLDPRETVEMGALRELREETGVTNISPHLVGVYSDPERDPRTWVVTVAFAAVVSWAAICRQQIAAGDDAREVGFAVAYPEKLPALAFDHSQIATDAVIMLRDRAMHAPILSPLMADIDPGSNGHCTMVPKSFAAAELADVYAAVFDTTFHAADLAATLAARGVICPAGPGNNFRFV